jgi:hypothetical protein
MLRVVVHYDVNHRNHIHDEIRLLYLCAGMGVMSTNASK